jgi:hypothetical protein
MDHIARQREGHYNQVYEQGVSTDVAETMLRALEESANAKFALGRVTSHGLERRCHPCRQEQYRSRTGDQSSMKVPSPNERYSRRREIWPGMSCTIDEDRDSAVGEHLERLAAEHDRGNPAPPM